MKTHVKAHPHTTLSLLATHKDFRCRLDSSSCVTILSLPLVLIPPILCVYILSPSLRMCMCVRVGHLVSAFLTRFKFNREGRDPQYLMHNCNVRTGGFPNLTESSHM